MSETRNDGGAAFPGVMGPPNEFTPGMTLRDWFAARATEGDIQAHTSYWSGSGIYASRSREEAKYAYADAMLAERAKG